jgi:hypothetical protein
MPIKIGIITHHYINNFGAFLQLYALYRTLQSLLPDATVEVIDFRVEKHYFQNRRSLFIRKIRPSYVKEDVHRWLKEIQLAFIYRSERCRMKFSRPVKNATEINTLHYDAVVIGSDEVWYYGDSSYSPVKFGSGLSSAKIVSYAPSIGGMMPDRSLPEEIPIGLNAFTHLSARDKNTVILAKSHVNKPVTEVLDPIFLYNFEETVLPGGIAAEKYIVCYYEEGWDEDLVNIIKQHAASQQLRIVGAGCASSWYDRCLVNITPFEWVSIFKHAAMVITGTFHGAAFGLKFNKKLIACPGNNFPNRIEKTISLLTTLGAESFMLDAQAHHVAADLQKIIDSTFDMPAIQSLIARKRAESIDFLKSALLDL